MTNALSAARSSSPPISPTPPAARELENPWRPVGLLLAFLLALAGDGALALGVPLLPALVLFGVSGGVLGYAITKRYRLERVSEEDIAQLPELVQLQLLAHLYCLDERGGIEELRGRLCEFSRAHQDRVFLWVAPESVRRLAHRLSGLPPLPAPRRIPAPLRRVRKLRSYMEEAEVVAEAVQPVALPTAAPPPAVTARRRRRRRSPAQPPPASALLVQSAELVPCPICGVTVPSERRLCPYCGAKLTAELHL